MIEKCPPVLTFLSFSRLGLTFVALGWLECIFRYSGVSIISVLVAGCFFILDFFLLLHSSSGLLL